MKTSLQDRIMLCISILAVALYFSFWQKSLDAGLFAGFSAIIIVKLFIKN